MSGSIVQRPVSVAVHRFWWWAGAVLAVGVAGLAILNPHAPATTATFSSISAEPVTPDWVLLFVENLGWMLAGLFAVLIVGAFSLDRGLRADTARRWRTYVAPPLQVVARPIVRHWQMTAAVVLVFGTAGGLALNVTPLSAVAMIGSTDNVNDNAFFITSSQDWQKWQLSGVTVTKNGAIQLAEDNTNAKWVEDTRAPKERYFSCFELDADHVWYNVADKQCLIYYNGTGYETYGSFGTPSSKIMWGYSPDNVWSASLVGHSTMYHYDGTGWSQVMDLSEAQRDMDGSTLENVWAVGDAGSVYQYDGTGWRENKPSPQLRCPFERVRAFASNDVVIAGATGIMFRWDGSSWNMITGPMGGGSLTAIEGPNSQNMQVRSVNGNSYRTHDGGKSWQQTKSTPETDRHWKVENGKIYHRASGRYVREGSATRTFTTDQSVRWTDAVITPPGSAQVRYSTDGQTWQQTTRTLPVSDRLTVKLKLATPTRRTTPRLESFSLGYAP